MRSLLARTGAAVALVLLTGCSVEAQIAAVFGRYGPQVVEEAQQVAWCESRYEADAVSPAGHVSIFQFDLRYHAHRPGMDRWREPLFASLAAEDLWLESGRSWRPWSCRP